MRQGHTPGITFNQLKAVFEDKTYCKATVYRLQKEYDSGRLKVGDLARSGRPRTARNRGNIEVCRRAVQRDKHIKIHHLSNLLMTSYGTVHHILHQELALKKRVSKYVPHVLTEAQMRKRVAFVVNFLDSYPGGRGLKWVVTSNESWFHVNEPFSREGNKMWLAKGEDRGQVPMRSRSCKKILMIPFFDERGIVHVEYLMHGTVNRFIFKAILERAWASVQTRRRDIW